MLNRVLILSISLAACSGAAAQQMYKTVGADGKVTFSDRPALESAASLSVMRSNTLRPVSPSAPMTLAMADVQPQLRPAAPAAAGGQAAAPATITPDIEAAIAQVMAQSEFSRRFYPYCNSTQSDARAFTKAAAGWKQRNSAVVEHQRKLLMQVVSPAKRSEIQEKVGAMLAEESARLNTQQPPERAQWCAGAIAQMASESADIKQPELMAVPLTAFKSR